MRIINYIAWEDRQANIWNMHLADCSKSPYLVAWNWANRLASTMMLIHWVQNFHETGKLIHFILIKFWGSIQFGSVVSRSQRCWDEILLHQLLTNLFKFALHFLKCSLHMSKCQKKLPKHFVHEQVCVSKCQCHGMSSPVPAQYHPSLCKLLSLRAHEPHCVQYLENAIIHMAQNILIDLGATWFSCPLNHKSGSALQLVTHPPFNRVCAMCSQKWVHHQMTSDHKGAWTMIITTLLPLSNPISLSPQNQIFSLVAVWMYMFWMSFANTLTSLNAASSVNHIRLLVWVLRGPLGPDTSVPHTHDTTLE